jgi:hypothetical protein
MTFFAIPNLSSHDVEVVDPTTSKLSAPRHDSKEKRRAWQSAVTTQHLFYSACEGLTPGLRVSERNESYKLHGLVCDYDSEISDADLGAIVKRAAPELLPMWTSHTFSGGARLVFEFEKPVYVDNHDLADRFLKELGKELRLKNLLPGLDDKSFSLTQYFELGTDWRRFSEAKPISSNILQLLFYRAAEKKVIRGEGPNIPIEAVAAEVEKRWPGRIKGEFTVGVRTPLFWIDDGIDRIGAQVGDFGMICYSTRAHKSFFHWGEILGHEFVRNYQAERIGGAADGLWFDGRHYWRKGEDGYWRYRNKQDAIMWLKGKGISARTSPKETASEAEKVLLLAQDVREVKAAAPIVHDSREVVIINGERYLNISTVKIMQPADSGDPANWPWLHDFFWKIWASPQEEQRDHFLAWLQHYYVCCLNGRPAQGQAIVIAGAPSRGKTFLNYQILGRIMGGHSDATDFLMGKTNFNKENAEVALWPIDDTRGAGSWENKSAFSAALKKHVANPQVRCEGKGVNACTIPWKGRIVVTCNTDKESLDIVPHLNATIKDKLMLFMWGDWQAKFLPAGGSEAVVAKELPYFLAWLRGWKPPAHVLADNPRYAVKAYHHPTMLREARDASPAARLEEMLELWRESRSETEKEPIWANPSKIRHLLTADGSVRDGLREFNRNRMAAALEELNLPTRSNGNSTEYLILRPRSFDVTRYLTGKERKLLRAASKGENGQQI